MARTLARGIEAEATPEPMILPMTRTVDPAYAATIDIPQGIQSLRLTIYHTRDGAVIPEADYRVIRHTRDVVVVIDCLESTSLLQVVGSGA
jgi:hypothetical protein